MKKSKTPIEYLTSLGVPIDNQGFSLVYQVEEDCYDFVLKLPSYVVNDAFLDLMTVVNLLGQNCPKSVIRFGAKVHEKKSGIIKPKLILN